MNPRLIRILSLALFLSLLLWGVFTLLVYLGVPVHGTVLAPAAQESVNDFCQPHQFLCRGVYTFVPFVTHTLKRLPFAVWYAVVSLVLYLLFLGWYALRTGRFTLQIRFTPLKFLLLCLLSLWLIFTCISFLQTGDMPMRRFVEPTEQVYQKAGPEALATLRANFERLQDRGCLRHIGEFGNGAKAFTLKTRCIQRAFFSRVLPLALVVLAFLFELLVAGRFLLSLLRLRSPNPFAEMILSIGLGIGVWIVLLWTIAVFGMFTKAAGWAFILLMPAALYRHSRYWLRRFVSASWVVNCSWRSISLLLAWLLVSYFALNFLNVVRPFPIGWDDLGVYLNRPRLMVSYGGFVYSIARFEWEYLTSLGFLLFGFESDFGAAAAMMINWTAGLIAVLAVYAFARTYLGRGSGLLASLAYYMLPLVGHFSFADMKIDNAVFAMGALAAFAVFLALFPPDPPEGDREDLSTRDFYVLIGIGGLFAGFAFAIKATAIMAAMAIGAILAGTLLHWSGFVAAVLFAFGIFVKQGNLSVADIAAQIGRAPDAVSRGWALAFFFGVAAAVLLLACFLRRGAVRRTALSLAVFGAAFLATVVPWTTHNNLLQGSSLFHLQFAAPNSFTPLLDYTGANAGRTSDDAGRRVWTLPEDLRVDPANEACSPSGKVEELDRYWGDRKGWSHYLTLPWRSVMNIDSAGYYVTTMPALLLFPLLLFLPYFWMRAGRWLRWLFLGTLFLVLQWVFLANGILWYGIGMFLGLAVALEALVARAPDVPNRALAGALLGLSLLACLGMRFWQFDQQRNLFEYVIGKADAPSMRERTIPHYDDIADLVVQRNRDIPLRPYLYRVGTFIPYFIPRNLEIIGISDHQLDVFNCLYQERDPRLAVERLKALGFNSIVFDTNTATIERDPTGSLHQKVNAFVDFLNNPVSGLQILINDSGAGVTFFLIP